MEYQAQETNPEADEKPLWKQYNLFHAATAQWCYTGAQVAIASSFINYATTRRANTDNSLGAKFFAGAQAAFAIGRFAGSALMKFSKPRHVFLAFLTGCVIFIAPAITQRENTGISMLYVVLFFESVCFPTIVALGMRGLGRHTKRGSGYIVAGVSGGAVIPAITFAVADKRGNGLAMIVPMMFLVAAWTYPICVNFVPSYKRIIDSFYEAEVGLEARVADLENSTPTDEKAHVSAVA